MRHDVCVDPNPQRLAAAVVQERAARRWTQKDLAEASGLGLTTVQRIEAADSPTQPSKRTLRELDRVFGRPENWARSLYFAAEPTTPDGYDDRADLVDPDSPDPIIRELSTGPVTSEQMRRELIWLYLEDRSAMEARIMERASRRARRLAAADAMGLPPADRQAKLESLSELRRRLGDDDEPSNSDTPGHERDTA